MAAINPFGLPLAGRRAEIPLVQQPRIPRLVSHSQAIRRLAALAAAALLVAGCGRGPSAFGATPAEARAGATDFFGALALRFGPLSRTPKLEELRPRLVRHSLSPSKIFDDTTLGSWRSGATRTMVVAGGRTVGGGYQLAHRPRVGSPERPGDGRATIQLTQLGAGEYAWHSVDELAAGGTSAASLGAVLVRTFAALEGIPAPAIRAGYRQALPHTTAALARYITLDSVRSVRQADGASLMSFVIRLDPKRLEATMPAFAKYAREYISPARYRISLTDEGGALWLEAVQDDDVLRLRFRTLDGVLVPMGVPPRPIPETFQIGIEFFARVMVFTVGVSELTGDLRVVRTPGERSLVMRFREEPVWHLPLAVEHFLRSSLRRPFEDDGLGLALIARDAPGGVTLLQRDLSISVQESAIVRWIGGLGNRAMGDVTKAVELEKDTFTGDIFRGLSRDVSALIGGEGLTGQP